MTTTDTTTCQIRANMHPDSKRDGCPLHGAECAPDFDPARAGYIAGLRQLADLLAANDDLGLPFDGGPVSRLGIFVDSRDEVLAWVRAMDGPVSKQYDDSPNYGFQAEGVLSGLHLRVYAPRGEVCERVVTGVETVTVPAQPAVEALPERTEEREVVEWRCVPLLADDAPVSQVDTEDRPFAHWPPHGSERACHEGDCRRCELEREHDEAAQR